MKTVKSMADLQRLALATGAEIVGSGTRFNSERAQVQRMVQAAPIVAPTAEPPVLTPAPIPAQTFTRQDVERLLSEQEQRFQAQLASMLAAVQGVRQKAEEGLVPVGVSPTYNADGEITFVGIEYRRLQ